MKVNLWYLKNIKRQFILQHKFTPPNKPSLLSHNQPIGTLLLMTTVLLKFLQVFFTAVPVLSKLIVYTYYQKKDLFANAAFK